MRPIEPLPLHHSWPLFECVTRFDPALLCDDVRWAIEDGLPSLRPHAPTPRGVGVWECDLRDDSLTWSDDVYDIFGLPRGARVSRAEAVALYREESRAAMERLRAYAIKHCRGFTLDARIRPAVGRSRWIRLVAAPVCENGRAVRLRGLKWKLPRK